jgi:hypothetical protein
MLNLEELCTFTLITDSYNFYFCENLFMESSLMFCGYEQFGKEAKNSTNGFKQLSVSCIKINNISQSF